MNLMITALNHARYVVSMTKDGGNSQNTMGTRENGVVMQGVAKFVTINQTDYIDYFLDD